MSQTNPEKPRINPGPMPAKIFGVAFIGHISFSSKDPKSKPAFYVFFETQQKVEYNGEMKPMVISQRFNYTWNDKALFTKFIRTLFNNPDFSYEQYNNMKLTSLIGKDIGLVIKHNGKYDNIDSFYYLQQGSLGYDKPIQKKIAYHVQHYGFAHEEFDNMYTWIQKLALTSLEYQNYIAAGGKPITIVSKAQSIADNPDAIDYSKHVNASKTYQPKQNVDPNAQPPVAGQHSSANASSEYPYGEQQAPPAQPFAQPVQGPPAPPSQQGLPSVNDLQNIPSQSAAADDEESDLPF